MLPNIDPAASAASVGAAVQPPQVKKNDSDKAIDAYNTNAAASAARVKTDERRVRARDEARGAEAREAQRLAEGESAARTEKSKTDAYLRQWRDQAEINFQLTREERAVFLGAMSGEEDPARMTEQEQGILQKAAERIDKIIDEATTRRTDREDRLDKAIKEWYSRLANGKHEPPANLLALIQQAAAGNLDFEKMAAGV